MARASVAILLVGAVMLSSILSAAVAENGTLGVYKPHKPSPFKQSVPVYSPCEYGGWNSSAYLKSNEAIFTGNHTTCGWTYALCRHTTTHECNLESKIARKIVKVVATCAGCYTFLVSQASFNQVAGAGAKPGFPIDYTRIIIN